MHVRAPYRHVDSKNLPDYDHAYVWNRTLFPPSGIKADSLTQQSSYIEKEAVWHEEIPYLWKALNWDKRCKLNLFQQRIDTYILPYKLWVNMIDLKQNNYSQ